MPQRDFCIGVTGTRQGPNSKQIETIIKFLEGARRFAVEGGFRPVLRHGDCYGVDDEVARIAKNLGYWVIAHPCNIHRWRAYCPASDWGYGEKPPLDRNKDIVDKSDYMLVVPKETERIYKLGGEPIKSGTWSTKRYAQKKKKPYFVVWA